VNKKYEKIQYNSSWYIETELVKKKMEKSELANLQGFVIASSYWNFFEVENLELDETRNIKFEFYGRQFNEKIKKSREKSPAARIFFSKELKNLIESIFINWKDNKYEEMSQNNRNPVMVFKKIDKDFYQLDFETFDEVTLKNKKETIKKEYQNHGDIIHKIKKYISIQNFNYEEGMIENFYLSLKTKPFVILAGISGTGKTKLVELFAKAIGCEENFDIIPVKPDWSDTSDLLGYKNLQGRFNPGPLMDIIIKANNDEDDKIHFVCLDEMNLARVEYYFSDFLSIMETRHFSHEKILSKPLFKDDYFCESDKEKYAGIYFPENLYFVGTVNMDETTYPFSKKVLDRANTIEFSHVELDKYNLSNSKNIYEPITVDNDFLVSEKLTLNDCTIEDEEVIKKVVEYLKDINEILKRESIHFGYRIRDEIIFYMLYNEKYNLLEFDIALDFQLMQKVLPRIQGSTESIKNILVSLLELSGFKGLSSEEGMLGDLLTEEKINECQFIRTASKLAYMIKKLEIDGFTSYWL